MPGRKKVLIFNAGPIFPVKGMHQVRIFNQIKRLSKDHDVDFMFLSTRQFDRHETREKLKSFCLKTIPVKTFTQGFVFRGLRKIILKGLSQKLNYPLGYFSNSNQLTSRAIARKINARQYNVVISHYWEASGFLRFLQNGIVRAIDTHYLVEENLDLYEKGMYQHLDHGNLHTLLNKELSIQSTCFHHAVFLIVNSLAQKNILEKQGRNSVLCVPNGQELSPFLEYPNHRANQEKNLLFYGALSNQFNQKALRRILDRIWPLIRKKQPDAKLIIMGSLPPEWLQDISKNDPALEVTGFVDDVRPVFSRCTACLLPLDSGSGFRGRTVELLASGVPIIGTANALQSVQITHEKNGIIADTDDMFVNWGLKLLADKGLVEKLSLAGKEFAASRYSLDATFGKLSEYLTDLKI